MPRGVQPSISSRYDAFVIAKMSTIGVITNFGLKIHAQAEAAAKARLGEGATPEERDAAKRTEFTRILRERVRIYTQLRFIWQGLTGVGYTTGRGGARCADKATEGAR